MGINFKTCPECGQKSVQKVTKDYKEADGNVIPLLDYFQCSSCKAVFFDDFGMRRIEAARSHSNRSSRKKTATVNVTLTK